MKRPPQDAAALGPAKRVRASATPGRCIIFLSALSVTDVLHVMNFLGFDV